MNTIHKYFENFSKLFYWLLIVTIFLLTADIVGLLFLNKKSNEIFTEIRIDQILLIFIFQVIFIFIAKAIFEIIKFLSFDIRLRLQKSSDDDWKKDYYNLDKLLNISVKTNNQTMYNYYKDYNDKLKTELNQKYLCFTLILLFTINAYIKNSVLRLIIENYNNYSNLKKSLIVLIIIFYLLGSLISFMNSYYSDRTEISKK